MPVPTKPGVTGFIASDPNLTFTNDGTPRNLDAPNRDSARRDTAQQVAPEPTVVGADGPAACEAVAR